MKAWFACIVILISGISHAGVTGIQVTGGENHLNVEMQVAKKIRSRNFKVDFINETIQVNLPGLLLEESKKSVRVKDDVFRMVYLYQYKPNILRVRIILKKGIAAHGFQGAVNLNHSQGKLRILVAKRETEELTSVQRDQVISRTVLLKAIKKAEFNAPAEDTPVSEVASAQLVLGFDDHRETQTEKDIGVKEAAALEQAVDKKISEANANVERQAEEQIPAFKGQATSTKQKEAGLGSGFKYIYSLIIVLSVFGVLAFIAYRVSQKKAIHKKGAHIKMMSNYYLGPKKSLAIVQVAGEYLLLGVTDNQISLLKPLSLIDDEFPESVPKKFSDLKIDEEAETDGEEFTVAGLKDFVSGKVNNLRSS